MAIQTVWSVDLGRSSLKAVKLRRSQGNVEIVAIDKVDYPISANGTDSQAQAREALGIFAARHAIKDPVAIAHPGQGTFSRFIKVPAFDEKKVTEMVGHEAAQQIPFPLDEVTWDFHIIDRQYLPGEEREVAIFAVRREQIDDFILEFTSHDLTVETVSIGYLGLLNFVQHDIAPDAPAIVLDIGAAHTDLVLVDGKRFWIRALPHSGNAITKSIQDRFKLGFAEAEKLKIETAKVPQRAVKIFQAVIQPKLKELVGEIHRSIGFYRSQHGEVNFTKLYLLGNGSKVIGIKKFLEESLGLPVERVQTINHFRVSRDVNLRLLQAHLPAFAATLGCGLQALGLAPCDVDLVPSEEKLAKEVNRKKKHVFFAAGIVFVALFLSTWMLGRTNSDAAIAVRSAKSAYDELGSGAETVANHDRQKQEFEAIVEEVRALVVLRTKVLAAVQALDATLSEHFPENSLAISETLPDDAADARVREIEQQLERSVAERVWIPSMLFERTTYEFPADEPVAVRDSFEDPAAAPVASAAQAKPVPAYRFKIQLMMTKRQSQQRTVEFARDVFGKKLEEAFKTQGLAVVEEASGMDPARAVQVGVVTTDLPVIGPLAQSRRGEADSGQQGRPFDSVEVSWLVVEKIPEKPGGSGGEDMPDDIGRDPDAGDGAGGRELESFERGSNSGDSDAGDSGSAGGGETRGASIDDGGDI